MFTNLDFLNIGSLWQPKDVDYQTRVEAARVGRQLYEGDFLSVFQETWRKIATRYGSDWGDIQQVIIQANLFKTLTETFKTLAFKDCPKILDTKNEKMLNKIINDSDFIDTVMKRSFISGHAQGTGIFKVILKNNKPRLISINPECYIPVYEEDDIDTVKAHVVFKQYKINRGSTLFGEEKYEHFLKVEINEVSKVTTRLYKLKNLQRQGCFKLDELLDEQVTRYKNWNDFLIFTFDYGKPNWRDFAKSQYEDIIPIIDEIIVRLSNNSRILDDHADPQIIAPDEALEFDSNSGQRTYKRHKVLKMGRGGLKPEYLTWNGSLDASEKHLDRIMNLFYMISGTNPQMFGKDIAGNLSGDALSKILLIPVSKTKEMVLALEKAATKALNCALSLTGAKADVNIEFEIGSFNQLEDISNQVQAEVTSGIRSIDSAVKKINPKISDDEVKAEVELIKNDTKVTSSNDLGTDTGEFE